MRINNSGFTLIELIIVMFVSLIFIALAFSYFLYNSELYTQANAEMEIQDQCSKILEILTVSAKESHNINQPDPALPAYEFLDVDGTDFLTVAFFEASGILEISGYPLERNIDAFSINEIVESDGTINTRLREITITGMRNNEFRSFSTIIAMRN